MNPYVESHHPFSGSGQRRNDEPRSWRLVICALASLSVFAACIGGWWHYRPIWEIEARVKAILPAHERARFSNVTFDKSTNTGCGYVDAEDRGGRSRGKTHFILLPDGSLKFDPKDRVQGTTLQQLESVRNHAEYLALVYSRCPPV
ncbi:MAG: hypothetical protein WKG52_13690 [Variovorax sp.]